MVVREITAEAASNIALIKYWGATDLASALPVNPSISMTLSRCRSRCSATFHEGESGEDEILLLPERGGQLETAPREFREPIAAHLTRLRTAFERPGRFRIATHNTFPAAAGIASSASGFTALTLAASRALGEPLDAEQLSQWSRRSGSGSAARSAFGGWVEWPRGPGEGEAHAFQLAGEDDWQVSDLVTIVASDAKKVSSREGHRRAPTSPYFPQRQAQLPRRLEVVRRAIAERDFSAMAETVEEESIDLHLIAMSSNPAIFYWRPTTLAVLERVRELRRDGLPVCSTMDAGPNVHVLCLPEVEQQVLPELEAIEGVERVLSDRTGGAPVWREGAEL